MTITREVVTDLLPLYDGGEASPDTRALVEAFFRTDPEFERLARAARPSRTAPTSTDTVPDALERDAIVRTRKALRSRSWIIACAVFFSLLPFTFVVRDGKLTFLMFRDVPEFRTVWLIGAALWVAYAKKWWGLRSSGW